MNKILISIIIPTFNRCKYLQKTLESVVVQNIDDDLYEILVINNNSTDHTQKVIDKYIRDYKNLAIRYIFEPISGLLSGRHRGVKESQGEILVFIDDDIIADPNWLISIKKTFENNSINIVGGKNLPNYEIEPPDWLEYFWIITNEGKFCGQLSLLDFGENAKFIDPNFIWGLNFSIRKSTLIELGGFHPDTMPKSLQHLQGDGETGLTLKAKEKKIYGFYQPNALVYHFVPKERLTIEYFIERHFFQGVADSYTVARNKIHNSNQKTNIIGSLIGVLKIIYNLIKRPNKIREYIFKMKFNKSYKQGFMYHQYSFIKNKKTHEWIKKENYFNYDYTNFM